MAFTLGNNAAEMASNKPASAATAFQLAGAETGAQTIVAAIGDTNQSVFMAQKVDANKNPAGAWQIFLGTVTDATPDTISQDSIIKSSTGSSAIDWSATGENSSPLITAVVDVARIGSRRIHSSGSISGSPTYITIGGSSNPFTAGKNYEIEFIGLRAGTDAVSVRAEVYSAGAWDTAAGKYASRGYSAYDGTTSSWANGGTLAYWGMSNLAMTVGNATTSGAEELFSAVIELLDPANPNAVPFFRGFHSYSYSSLGQQATGEFCGQYEGKAALLGIRVFPSGGTWDSGSYICWEIDKTA